MNQEIKDMLKLTNVFLFVKILVKIQVKNMGKNFIDSIKNLSEMHLKPIQKEQFKKQQKQEII